MPKKLCNFKGCNAIISYRETYCEAHKEQRKQMEKVRQRKYDGTLRDQKTKNFYNSRAWRIKSAYIKSKGYNICRLCFEKQEKSEAAVTHHIEELREHWVKGLEDDNLIPLCDACHQQVHADYEKGKTIKAERQRQLSKLVANPLG